MDLRCDLCPNFSTRSQAVKRRHKAGHSKRGEFSSDGKRGQEGGQGGKGDKLVGGGQVQGPREGAQEAGGVHGIKVMFCNEVEGYRLFNRRSRGCSTNAFVTA